MTEDHWNKRAEQYGAQGVLNISQSEADRTSFDLWQKAQVIPLLDIIINNSGCNTTCAIDFGCGSGRFSNILADYFDEVLAYDRSKAWASTWTKADNVNKLNGSLKWLEAYVTVCKPTFIWTSTVLQHISDEDLPEVARVLNAISTKHAYLCLHEHTNESGTFQNQSIAVDGTISYCWHRPIQFYKDLFPMFELSSMESYKKDGDMTFITGFKRR